MIFQTCFSQNLFLYKFYKSKWVFPHFQEQRVHISINEIFWTRKESWEVVTFVFIQALPKGHNTEP